MFTFQPLGLAFPMPTTAARNYNFSDRDFQLLVLSGLSEITKIMGTTEATTAPAQVTVAATAGGTVLLAAASTGKRCSIFNHSAVDVTISDGGTPAAGIGTAVIKPGGYWERPWCSKSAIKGIAASGTAVCNVTTTA